jgi:hypothetical protein
MEMQWLKIEFENLKFYQKKKAIPVTCRGGP